MCSQPLEVYQMIPQCLEKHKQDEEENKEQKQFFHGSDIITYVFLKNNLTLMVAE